jgi:glycosyltransferase involved in cell wall biosynthesis
MQTIQPEVASPVVACRENGPPAPRFSLILASCGRTFELERYFQSLAALSYRDFECIVVDQNPDDRLTSLLGRWGGKITIRHLRSAKGLSRARNVGLLEAEGEIIAFPDDDCWYTPGLLGKVAEFFAANLNYAILSVGVRDVTNRISGNRWVLNACDLSTANIFRTSVGYSLFLRRQAVHPLPFFDESLGVGAGTPFASGEDTDFVLGLLARGLKGRFNRHLTIHHARGDMFSGRPTGDRAYAYGCGMGRVIRNRRKFPLFPAFVTFDFARAGYSFLRGRFDAAALCTAHGRGICAGYLAPK